MDNDRPFTIGFWNGIQNTFSPVVAYSTTDRECPWFEYYASITRMSLGTKHESPRLHLTQCVNWYPERAVSVKVTHGCHMVTAYNTGSEIVFPRRPGR